MVMYTPTYSFETPILGGQFALGMTALFGKNTSTVTATLTGPRGNALSGSYSDSVTGFGDLYPAATLKWVKGDHNFMVYGTTGIPVGEFDINRLSAMGLGRWAVDGGVGYTYYNEKAGFEFSAVSGLTYNFVNPYTDYRSGIDWHLDWSLSPYVGDKWMFGAVGYFYHQLTDDRAPTPLPGNTKSRVAAIGPQLGFFFELGGREAALTFKTYHEFDAHRRLEGWNGWVVLSVDAHETRPIRRWRRFSPGSG
jgi:hypothetical protein